MHLLQVGGVVLDGAFPGVRAGGASLVVDGLEAPIVGRRGVRDVEERLDRLIVAHYFAPEDFLAEVHFPAAGQLAPTMHLGLGDDLVPAVFRVAEYGRPGLFEPVGFRPEAAGFGHLRRGGDGHHAFGQPTQHVFVLGRHGQIVACVSRDDPAGSRLFQAGRFAVAVVDNRSHGSLNDFANLPDA